MVHPLIQRNWLVVFICDQGVHACPPGVRWREQRVLAFGQSYVLHCPFSNFWRPGCGKSSPSSSSLRQRFRILQSGFLASPRYEPSCQICSKMVKFAIYKQKFDAKKICAWVRGGKFYLGLPTDATHLAICIRYISIFPSFLTCLGNPAASAHDARSEMSQGFKEKNMLPYLLLQAAKLYMRAKKLSFKTERLLGLNVRHVCPRTSEYHSRFKRRT